MATTWTTPTAFTSLSYFTKTKGDTQLIDNLTHLGDEHLHSGVSGEGAGTLTVANGTEALPSYAFLNDTDCGFYRIGANNIGMSIGATKLLDLSSAAFAVTGSIAATTTIKYADWGISIPQVPFVSGVQDSVTLALDFVATPK